MKTQISRFVIFFFPLICFCMLAQVISNGIAQAGEVDFMWWRMTGSERLRDGGMTVNFELHLPPGGQQEVEIFRLSFPRKGTSSMRSFGTPDVFRRSLPGVMEPLRLSVYSGRTEKIELCAKTCLEGAIYYARTVIHCYGESGNPDLQWKRADAVPEWPGFRFEPQDDFYRAQTGAPITVKCVPAPLSVEVFENREAAATLNSKENGVYSYISPHDKNLSQSGYSAKKDLVFVALLPDDSGTASFYLPVYRAFYGQANLKGGLAVLSVIILLSFVFVTARGREFRWR